MPQQTSLYRILGVSLSVGDIITSFLGLSKIPLSYKIKDCEIRDSPFDPQITIYATGKEINMLALAVIPSIILIIAVWKYDTVEKEPLGLLIKLFILGGLTIIPALVLELAGGAILGFVIEDTLSMSYLVIDNFIITALVEELGKYFVLKVVTWKNKEFNYTFDAVVYAVVVSLGFATIENILYVAGDGVGTAIARAIFSIPGHAIDGVFMGFFYGLARYAEGAGQKSVAKKHLREALLIPVIMHGFYDFCLSSDNWLFYLAFAIYEIVITVITIKQIKKLSQNDTAIPGMVVDDNVFQTNDW